METRFRVRANNSQLSVLKGGCGGRALSRMRVSL